MEPTASVENHHVDISNEEHHDTDWTEKFQEKLESSRNNDDKLDNDCHITIFKVPRSIKVFSAHDFDPHVLNLGLHNRNIEDFGNKEPWKWRIVCSLDLELQKHGKNWEMFVREVVPDPATIRSEYEAPNKCLRLIAIQFLLTIDALFLVVFFQHRGNRHATSELSKLMSSDDYQRQLPPSLKTDLAMMENQVPMAVLVNVSTQLCNMQGKDDVQEAVDLVLKEAIYFLYPFMHGEKEGFMAFLNSSYSLECSSLLVCDHILDCVYRVVCRYSIPFPAHVVPTDKVISMKRIMSAINLKERGVRVEGTPQRTMTQIRFSSSRLGTTATLSLPTIKIFDHTVPLFRNLAVYEQLANNNRCRLRSYLQLMSQLLPTRGDVQLLSRSGVISNPGLDDASVADSWSKICYGIIAADPEVEWYTMHLKIHKYCSKLRKALRRRCHEEYFSKPWRTIAVAATLILIFTFVQAYASVVSANSLRPHFNW